MLPLPLPRLWADLGVSRQQLEQLSLVDLLLARQILYSIHQLWIGQVARVLGKQLFQALPTSLFIGISHVLELSTA